MKTFRFLKTTLSASFDNLIQNVENQEAIVNAAVRDIKEALINTKIHIRDVERGIHRAQKAEEDLKSEIATWEQRVKEIYETDPKLARECTYKILLLKDEISHCVKSISQGRDDLLRMENEKRIIQDKLREIQAKKRELISKQNLSKIRCSPNSATSDVEDLFKRWEDKITKNEIINDIDTEAEPKDQLESYFASKEKDKKVEEELERLIQEK